MSTKAVMMLGQDAMGTSNTCLHDKADLALEAFIELLPVEGDCSGALHCTAESDRQAPC